MIGNRKRKDRIWKLLVRHVTGESSRRDDEGVRSLIAMDESTAELLRHIQQIWDSSDSSRGSSQSDAAWASFQERRRRDAARSLLRAPYAAGGSQHASAKRRRARPGATLVRVAAVLVTAAVVTVVAFKLNVLEEPDQAPALVEPREFVTKKGQRASIQLTDGTNVFLNVDSRLTVPPDFEDGPREVHLEGEAYLNVAKDSTRPFVLHAGGASVQVLGTAFDVRAYPEEFSIQVVVAEGRVAMVEEDSARKDTLVLKPRDMAVVAKERTRAIRRGVDLDHYLSWTTGRLIFHDANFQEVTTALERWFDLEIEVVGPYGSVVGLNASFEDESLSEILNTIAATLNLRYERNRRHITFLPASSES